MGSVIEQIYRLTGIAESQAKLAGLAAGSKEAEAALAKSVKSTEAFGESLGNLGRSFGLPVEQVQNLARGTTGLATALGSMGLATVGAGAAVIGLGAAAIATWAGLRSMIASAQEWIEKNPGEATEYVTKRINEATGAVKALDMAWAEAGATAASVFAPLVQAMADDLRTLATSAEDVAGETSDVGDALATWYEWVGPTGKINSGIYNLAGGTGLVSLAFSALIADAGETGTTLDELGSGMVDFAEIGDDVAQSWRQQGEAAAFAARDFDRGRAALARAQKIAADFAREQNEREKSAEKAAKALDEQWAAYGRGQAIIEGLTDALGDATDKQMELGIAAQKVTDQAAEQARVLSAIAQAEYKVADAVAAIDAARASGSSPVSGMGAMNAAGAVMSGSLTSAVGMAGPQGVALAAAIQALQGVGRAGAAGITAKAVEEIHSLAAGLRELPKLMVQLPVAIMKEAPAFMEAFMLYTPRIIKAFYLDLPIALYRAMFEAFRDAWKAVADLPGQAKDWWQSKNNNEKALTVGRTGAAVATMGLSEGAAWVWNQLVGKDSKAAIPKFAQGTSYVRQDTLAMVHRGEEIVPAGGASQRAGGFGGGVTLQIQGVLGVDDVIRAIREQIGPYGRGALLQGY